MNDLDSLIAEAKIEVTTSGVNEAIAATGRLGASVDKLANSNENLANTDAQVAVVGERTTRYKISASAAAERLQRTLDQEYRSQKLLEAAMRDLERARQQGIISVSREAELIALAQTRYSGVTAALKVASSANDNHAHAVDLNRAQMLELGHVAKATFESLAAGAPIFTVLGQQGASAAQALSLGQGSLGDSLKSIGSLAARVFSPVVLGIGAVAGAVVYGYSAWSRYDDASRKVSVTLQGLGRETGLTVAGFEKLATTAAAAGNISVKQASDLGATFAATGKIGPDNIARLITVAKDAAATFGTDLDGVKNKLATAFSSAGGIIALNDQLQFLDARTLRVIKSLFDAGKEQDAIRMAIERLPAALAKSETAQGAVAKAWEAIKTAASDADTAIGRFLDRLTKGPAPEDRLKALQQRIEALKAADAENLVQPGGTSRTYNVPTSPTVSSTTATPLPPSRPAELKNAEDELRKYMDAIAETKRQEEALAAKKELEASLNRKSAELKKLTEEVGLGSDNWRKYQDLQIAAADALKSGDPELMKRVDNVKDLSEASSILAQVVKSTSTAEGGRLTAGDRAAEQRRNEIASTRAVTVEDKARVAQMQAEHAQRGQLITGEQALADATHAGQMVREQSDAQLRLQIRDQALEGDEIRKRIALIGLDAESRAVATAKQKAEQDLTRQGIDLNGDLAQSVIRGAEANARLNVSYDKATEAQQRMRDGQRELASEFETFVEGFTIGGQKISAALDTLSKSLSSNVLKALLTGEGPLAGILGTAASDRGQTGGLLGGKLNFGSLFDSDKIADSLGIGAEDGLGKAITSWLKESKAGGGLISSPLGQGLAAVGAGASVGYSSQSPIAGALAGGLAGLASGNPLLAAAGPAIGLGGFIGKRRATTTAPKPDTQEKPADDRDQRPIAA